MNFRISAVVPAFNAEKYLGEAIESILAQTVKVSEIVVVDDGSTDRTAEVAARFGVDALLIRQPHAGAAAARNHALKTVSGDWIAFLDADDVWTLDKIENQLKVLAAAPETEIIFGGVEEFVTPEMPAEEKIKFERFKEPVKGAIPSAMIVRRSVFDRVGIFNESYQIADFFDWRLRCRAAGTTEREAREIVARRRIHGQNLGIVKKEFQTEYIAILRKYKK
jgi:glycosyltransferase involved in cell wall biosynthesis